MRQLAMLDLERREVRALTPTELSQIPAEALASLVEAEKEGFEPSISETNGGKPSVDIFGGQA